MDPLKKLEQLEKEREDRKKKLTGKRIDKDLEIAIHSRISTIGPPTTVNPIKKIEKLEVKSLA
jgi:hypothetical protein